MSDFTLSPPILAAILCNSPPSSFSAPPPDNYCTVPYINKSRYQKFKEKVSAIFFTKSDFQKKDLPAMTLKYFVLLNDICFPLQSFSAIALKTKTL